MKTLLCIATVFISTVTFSQTSEKRLQASNSDKETITQSMNKAELIDAIAKDTGSTNNNKKSYGSTRSNKQTIRITENEPLNNQGTSRSSKNNNPLYKAKSEENTNPLFND